MQLMWLIAAQLSHFSGAAECPLPEPLSLFPLPEDPGAPADADTVRRRILRRLTPAHRKE